MATFSDFVLSGMASMCATVLTNPIEVIKTRIQLQGELAAKGSYVAQYKGVLQAVTLIAKHDGLTGLQKGLAPSLCFQFLCNGCRLTFYKKCLEKHWLHNRNDRVSFTLCLLCGAFGGAIGYFIASPFSMIKTQLQSQSSSHIAVGHQHAHKSMTGALSDIYAKGGIFGLWRGSLATLPRAAIAGGSHIAAFGKTKALLMENDLIRNPVLNSVISGLVAGTFMSIANTPADVISTRLYNQGVDAQGRGLLYNSWVDALRKILRAEGIQGLYKGFWANNLRITPQTTLIPIFLEQLNSIRNRYNKK